MYVSATNGVDKLLRPLSKDPERRPKRPTPSLSTEADAVEDGDILGAEDDGEPLGYSQGFASPDQHPVALPSPTPTVETAANSLLSTFEGADASPSEPVFAEVRSPDARAADAAFYDLLDQAAKG